MPEHHLASAADPADPYIVAQAAALSNDATKIFEFVRDQTVFQAYHGSVKGARGTLWSKGGNSLDRASLLIALLGAAGFSAQYVQGTISTAQEQTLILSMFPPRSRVVGCLPPTATLAAPQNDATLQAAIADHYWVEYGPSNIDLDPNFANAAAGQTFGAKQQTFTVANLPQALKQMVTVTLNVEMAQTSLFFGNTLQTPLGGSPELTFTSESALLVGMPLSLNHAVTGQTSVLGVTGTYFNYTPQLLLSSGGTDVEQDTVRQGTTYTESYSGSFGFFTDTYVTGIFVVVTAPNAQGVIQTYQHTVYDLIGYATRQANLANPANIAVPAPPTASNPQPVIGPTDVVTINVLPSLQSPAAFTNQSTRVQAEQTRFQSQQAALAALPTSNLNTQQQATLSLGMATEAFLEVALNELATMTFASTADYILPQIEQTYLSDPYYNSPRVIIGSSTSMGGFSLDLMKRDIKVVASPGQNILAPFYFEFARGMAESSSESKVLSEVLNLTTPAIGIQDVFAALAGTAPVYLDSTLLSHGYVQMPNLSADAQAYIQTALQSNKAVIAPKTTPMVNGQPVNMWLETDEVTGETVSMSDDGNHEAIFEWIVALTGWAAGRYSTFTRIAGFGVTGYSFAAGVLNGVAAFAAGAKFSKDATSGEGGSGGGGVASCWSSPSAGQCTPQALQEDSANCTNLACYVEAAFQQEDCVLAQIPNLPPPPALPSGVEGLLGLVEGMKCGAEQAQAAYLRMLPADPDVYNFLSSDVIPGPGSVIPGNSPAVHLTLTQDPFFTMPFSGGDLPTVFLANIQNTGPAAQTYNLSLGNAPGYQLRPSVSSLTVPAGETGQVGICAVPTGSGAPPVNFSASVAAADNPNVTSSNTTAITGGFNLTACEVTKAGLPGVPDVSSMVSQSLGSASRLNDLNADGTVNLVDIQIVINSVLGNGCSTK